jgi:hypothetical protein
MPVAHTYYPTRQIRRIPVGSQPWANSSIETLSGKFPTQKRVGGVA